MPNETRRTKTRGEAEKILALNRKDELNLSIETEHTFPARQQLQLKEMPKKSRTKQPEEKPKILTLNRKVVLKLYIEIKERPSPARQQLELEEMPNKTRRTKQPEEKPKNTRSKTGKFSLLNKNKIG